MKPEEIVKGHEYRCIESFEDYRIKGEIFKVHRISGDSVFYKEDLSCIKATFMREFEPVEESDTKFRVGDEVHHECSDGVCDYDGIITKLIEDKGCVINVTISRDYISCEGEDRDEFYSEGHLTLMKGEVTKSKQEREDNNMNLNKNIAKLYEKTSEAVLVDKHFGGDLLFQNGLVNVCLAADKKKVILAEAERLEEESKEKGE